MIVFKHSVEGGGVAVKSLSKHEMGTEGLAEGTPGERKERLKEWETFLNVPKAKRGRCSVFKLHICFKDQGLLT